MNFAEQLKAKKDLKAIELANEFLEEIKPKLITSAEKGYSAFEYTIDTAMESEKEKLQIYSNTVFIEHLNKNLDGVKAVYKREFTENILFKGYGWFKHYLIFTW
jgi:hypothetical protein